MMDFTMELPSSIPVITTRGGQESISIVKVGYKLVPSKCWNCWSFKHEEGNCLKSADEDVSMFVPSSLEKAPTELVEELSFSSQRKKKEEEGQ